VANHAVTGIVFNPALPHIVFITLAGFDQSTPGQSVNSQRPISNPNQYAR
jgi:hypothetical protein